MKSLFSVTILRFFATAPDTDGAFLTKLDCGFCKIFSHPLVKTVQ